MKPTKKSEGIDSFLKAFMGVDRVGAITSDICVSCKRPVGEFHNKLSAKEYRVSGLCQLCQDEIWGQDER